MDDELAATVSPRWHPPERSDDGTYWRARLRVPESAGALECDAYGPDADACAREAARHDRAWLARRDEPTGEEGDGR